MVRWGDVIDDKNNDCSTPETEVEEVECRGTRSDAF
jgi:hypothetical protein